MAEQLSAEKFVQEFGISREQHDSSKHNNGFRAPEVVAERERADPTTESDRTAAEVQFDRMCNKVNSGLAALLHRLVPLQHTMLELRSFGDRAFPGVHLHELDRLEQRLLDAAAALRAARAQTASSPGPRSRRWIVSSPPVRVVCKVCLWWRPFAVVENRYTETTRISRHWTWMRAYRSLALHHGNPRKTHTAI